MVPPLLSPSLLRGQTKESLFSPPGFFPDAFPSLLKKGSPSPFLLLSFRALQLLVALFCPCLKRSRKKSSFLLSPRRLCFLFFSWNGEEGTFSFFLFPAGPGASRAWCPFLFANRTVAADDRFELPISNGSPPPPSFSLVEGEVPSAGDGGSKKNVLS